MSLWGNNNSCRCFTGCPQPAVWSTKGIREKRNIWPNNLQNAWLTLGVPIVDRNFTGTVSHRDFPSDCDSPSGCWIGHMSRAAFCLWKTWKCSSHAAWIVLRIRYEKIPRRKTTKHIQGMFAIVQSNFRRIGRALQRPRYCLISD